MKRIMLPALLVLFLVPSCALRAQPPEGYGPPSRAPVPSWAGPGIPGGWGPGTGWGWGGGPWGGGYPGWGAGFGGAGSWFGYGPFSQIPQDKRDQLRELSVQTQRTLIGQAAALEEAAAALSAGS